MINRAGQISNSVACIVTQNVPGDLPRWWMDLIPSSLVCSRRSRRLLCTPEGSGLFLPQRLGKEVMIVSCSNE